LQVQAQGEPILGILAFFAAGGQNHRFTSSFDILPGIWIRIRHSLY